MNDELIYALIALSLHWWLGWRGMRWHRSREMYWNRADDLAGLLLVIVLGVLVWVCAKIRGSAFSIFGEYDDKS